jgi:dipeptidase E
MRFLLTSAGITNTSIKNALVELLGKPIAESSALVIPTAAYFFSQGPEIAYRLISGNARSPMCGLGWKSVGVLELTALPSIDRSHWTTAVQETDALLVGGGDPMYLCDWMRRSGFADLMPLLRREMVYVGLSGGSMAVTPSFGETYNDRNTAGYRALGLVDFSLGPPPR